MKKIFLSTLLVLCVCIAHAQTISDNYQIGYYFDIDKQAIEGYYDSNYQPNPLFGVDYTIGEDFTPGYYYTLEGEKVEGLIKYSNYNTNFFFKADLDKLEKKIKPDECIGYVIGVDSFTVIQNFNVQRNLGPVQSTKKEFAQVIDRVGKLTFYKHIRLGSQKTIITYLVKEDASSSYVSFPKEVEKFKQVALLYFGTFESLKEGIKKGKYEEVDIPTLVTLLKYKGFYDRNERIYFNSSWDEEQESEYSYYAEIDSIVDSVFHVTYYFANGAKMYDGDFTSFYPHKKRGQFHYYYPDGQIRKEVRFLKNKALSGKDYYPNGKVYRDYIFRDKDLYFRQVYDYEGNALLDATGAGLGLFYDSIQQREITYQYINHLLEGVFYFDSKGRKTYQLSSKNAKVMNEKMIRNKLANDFVYPQDLVKAYQHGFVLLKCIIEPTGRVSEVEMVKSLNPVVDAKVLNFFKVFVNAPSWKPAVHNREKVRQELVIPIDFSIIGFSRYRNHYNDIWMHQNLWMHHHMMNVVPVAPPSMPPAGFH